MDRARLRSELERTFDAPSEDCRAVARAAGDLADAGQYERDVGTDPSPALIVDELGDAPEDHGLIERWNWWIGSLELAFGGYAQFRIPETPSRGDA